MTAVDVTLIFVVVVALVLVLAPMMTAWRKARGVRLITCPETHVPEAVEIDATDAAFGALVGSREHWLKSCTRWPERQDCGQECLAQIEKAPHGCRVRTLLGDWYQGQSCALCNRPFAEIHAWDHKPAVMSPDRVTYEWSQLPAERLPELLKTWLPVCWDCHVLESLYRQHPELVVERPDRPKTHAAA
jgi:hypothetical protein